MNLVNKLLMNNMSDRVCSRVLDYLAKGPVDLLASTKIPLARIAVATTVIGFGVGAVKSPDLYCDEDSSLLKRASVSACGSLAGTVAGSVAPSFMYLGAHAAIRAGCYGLFFGSFALASPVIFSPVIVPAYLYITR